MWRCLPCRTLAISFHVALQRGAPSIGGSGTESYIASGRVSAQDAADGFSPLSGAVLLAAVDVLAGDTVRGAIVAFGDSITAGGRTSWPGVLASRLAAQPGPTMAVLNYGIGGNRLLFDSPCWRGTAAWARLDEALSQSGVTTAHSVRDWAGTISVCRTALVIRTSPRCFPRSWHAVPITESSA